MRRAFLIGLTLSTITTSIRADDKAPKTDALGDPLPAGAVARLGTLRMPATVGHEQPISSLAFLADGRILTGSRRDGTVRLWEGGKETRQWKDLTALSALAVSPDGARIAAGDLDGGLRIFDLGAGKLERTLQGPAGLDALSWTRAGLIAGTRAGRVDVWAGDKKASSYALYAGKDKEGTFLQLAPDATLLAASQHDSLSGVGGAAVRICQAASGHPVMTLDLSEATPSEDPTARTVCWSAAFSPDGKYLATSQSVQTTTVRTNLARHRVRLWEIATGKEVLALTDVRVAPSHMAFSQDGRMLAYATPEGYSRTGRVWGDHFIVLHDTISRAELARLYPEAGALSCLAFAPGGKTLVSAAVNDNTALVWDAARYQAKAETKEPTDEELATHWTDLAGDDAGKAYRALAQLVLGGDKVAGFLKGKMNPVAGDGKRLEQLIADLESEVFALRQKATVELGKAGDLAEGPLRRALANTTEPEFRRRLELLLQKIERGVPSPDAMRLARSLTVLERSATPAARELLARLATGNPDARLTRQARQALERLGR